MKKAILLIAALAMLAGLSFAQFPVTYTKTNGAPVLDRGPLVTDITGDGNPEILVVANAGGGNVRNQIRVYRSDGTLAFTLDLPAVLGDSFSISQVPAVADGDGDGNLEVVVGAWDSTEYTSTCGDVDCPLGVHRRGGSNPARCHHYYGFVLSWEISGGLPADPVISGPTRTTTKLTTPAVGDVAGPNGPDGFDDLIFVGADLEGPIGCGNDQNWWGNGYHVFRWQDNGWIRAGGQAEAATVSGNVSHLIGETMPTLGDISGDGVPEIFVLLPEAGVAGSAKLKVYDPTFNLDATSVQLVVSGWYPLMRNVPFQAVEDSTLPAPLLADVDRDGQLEVLFIVRNEDNSQQRLALVRTDNWSWGLWPLPTNWLTSGRSLMAVADGPFPNEGLNMYLAAKNGTLTRFYWFKPTGVQMNRIGWPKPFDATQAFDEHGYAPAIVSTDATNDLELVTQVGVSGNNLVRNLKLDNAAGSDFSWPISGGFDNSHRILSAPTVTDLNQDGTADLVIANGISATQAQIHAYNLGIPFSHELLEWNGFQNGPRHTGLYAQPVTGEQPRAEMKWSGRIIVHDEYLVPPNHLLTLEPGTVVEFRPGATLTIEGTLVAQGSGVDSIYFKPDVSEPWGPINIGLTGSATLAACVFDGGGIFAYAGSLVLEGCRFHDVDVAVDLLKAYPLINSNTIHNCDYGIRGTQSAGLLANNIIHSCTRAGIYWVGDIPETGEAALFSSNVIEANGSDPNDAIAGGYFNNTTARLECNQFLKNRVNQILCGGYGDVVMKTRPF